MDQLIDAYRMRVEDDYMYNGDIRGLYDGPGYPLPDFRSFLDLAERRTGVLPRWWNKDARKICEARALDCSCCGEIRYPRVLQGQYDADEVAHVSRAGIWTGCHVN